MEQSDILKKIDHTALAAVTKWEDIDKLCKEAVQYQMASVCIPPSYVKRAYEKYGKELAICTVIGFPLGYSTKESKVFEAANAVENGAAEVDMVINLGEVKNGDFDAVTEEIREIKRAVGGKILKVIVETCYLNEEEKIRLCRCVTEAGGDFIKTSTGFGTSGASAADVELFQKHIGKNVRIKAAGGIRKKEDFEVFYKAGVDRIGASCALKVYEG